VIPPPNRNVIKKVKVAVEDIESSIFPTLKDVFTRHSDIIKEINTEQQLYARGENSKGVSLGSYAESTRRIKIKKIQPVDRVTLKDTGDFYKSIEIIVEDDQIQIVSNLKTDGEDDVDYYIFLTLQYGDNILGIQEKELLDFTKKYISPELENNINEIIKAKML
jgi:hypothetical protein